MLIRPATLTDVVLIGGLGRSLQEFDVGTGRTFWSDEQLERWVQSPTDCTLVAASKRDIAGFLLAQYHPPTRKGVVENLYVDQRYRGQGIGQALLSRCEQELKNRGCVYLCALVQTENTSSWHTLAKAGFSSGHLFHWMGKEL